MNRKIFFKLIRKNPGKVVMILLLTICTVGVIITPNYKTHVEKTILETFEDGGKERYVVASSDDSYTVYDDGDGYSVMGDKLVSDDLPFLFWGSIVIGSICLICVVVAHFERELSWEYKEVKADVLMGEIINSREDDFIYYHLRGKLIGKSHVDKGLNNYRLRENMKVYVRTPNLLEDFEGTTSEKREKRLGKILSK
ncbi:MAG: hypothetical protein SLAVMIC_00855 [uncultured marine phage]|uniref:Uncharacterized protein n=1 Tax=uncultured marine phage TaxID=707152 RepID=A0A8D9FSH2_9VIRU|nr:MAG: hypothetical protein SLAVMIC_00855 [uncultured marine phage]